MRRPFKQTYIIDQAALAAALAKLAEPETSPPDHTWEDNLPEADDLPDDADETTVMLFPQRGTKR